MAVVTVASCLVGRRPFGVSGIMGRLLDWRAEAAAERSRQAFASADDEALEAALLAATAEAFAGMTPALEAAGTASRSPEAAAAKPSAAAAGASCGACAPMVQRPPLSAHAVFLLAIAGGGFLAAALRGGFQPTLALPEAYARLVAPGLPGWLGLGAGGLLIGVGASVSGGCSTGHGLTGCARLQPAGLAASATFFGVAGAVSFLLAGRLG
jgi:hypothetical protein